MMERFNRPSAPRTRRSSSPVGVVLGVTLLTLLCVFITACGSDKDRASGGSDGSAPIAKGNETPSHETSGTAGKIEHAPANYVPGSYEDWCGGHDVPESACTRCNASLIPAFQATGDWCAEHGIPESQCKLCNKDLVIQRPPKPEGK